MGKKLFNNDFKKHCCGVA